MSEEANKTQYTSIVTPMPDPTALTTAQLQRELVLLDRIFAEKLSALIERVDAMEKAQTLFHDDLVRVPTAVDKAVGQLKELHEKWFLEKFDIVQTQLRERDVRHSQVETDRQREIAAALQAAKEVLGEQYRSSNLAISKSEDAIEKRINGVISMVQTTTGPINDKIDDLKERLTLIEGRTAGITSATAAQQGAQGLQQGAQSLNWGIIALIVSVLVALFNIGMTLRH